MTIRFPHLNLQLNQVPGYYEILNFRITMMGIMIAAAMLLGVLIVMLEAKRRRKSVNVYLGASIAGILGGFAGARALYVAVHWELYQDDLMRILNFREGGFAFYGALFGGMVFVFLFCLISRQSFMEVADALSIALVFGQVIGRFGDFFCRQSFGEYTDSVLAMQIPLAGVHAEDVTTLMREHLVDIGGIPYVQVHPTFLYESAACLILFFVMLGINRKKRYPGQTFLTYLTWYGMIRLIVGWFRTDKMMLSGMPVDLNLVISAVMFVLFGLMGAVRGTMAKKRLEVRRARQELRYEEEEKAAAEFDRQEAERERKIREIGEERLREAKEAENPEDGQETSKPEAEKKEELGDTVDYLAQFTKVKDEPEMPEGAENQEIISAEEPKTEEGTPKTEESVEAETTADVSKNVPENPSEASEKQPEELKENPEEPAEKPADSEPEIPENSLPESEKSES